RREQRPVHDEERRQRRAHEHRPQVERAREPDEDDADEQDRHADVKCALERPRRHRVILALTPGRKVWHRIRSEVPFMYVVAGVSGNGARVTADELVKRGKPVKVVVRDAKKGAAWSARGAEVAVASLDDAAALGKALRGASGFFTLVPPSYTEPDFL